jgi:hypothetical protein
MAIYDVSIYEPVGAPWTADSTLVTADSEIYTADGGPLVLATDNTAAAINAFIYDLAIVEPAGALWTADSTIVTADSAIYTADGGPLVGGASDCKSFDRAVRVRHGAVDAQNSNRRIKHERA